MNAADSLRRPRHPPGWLNWLRREMVSTPGRLPMTCRMVVAVVLVTVISMAVQVPQLAFSAFFVFFVSKENRVVTAFTGALMILAVTIATVVSLIVYSFTFDYPELRIPFMAASIFTAMFLSRTFVLGPLGFSVGFFIALMQTVAETAPDTDVLVRGELWLWIAVVYPIALTVVVNQVFLPADPWSALASSLTQRVDMAVAALEGGIREGAVGGEKTNFKLLDMATRGCTPLLAMLGFAEMKDEELKRRHPFMVETIAASSHLVSATASFEFRPRHPLSEHDLNCARTLRADLAEIKAALPEHTQVLSSRQSLVVQAELPQLRELQFAAESIRDSLIRGFSEYSVATTAAKKKSLFSPDALTNPAHLRFALKVTFAALACYVIYSGLKWPGISTALVTCCFIALGNTGATIYKSWLRLTGCAIGGLMGYIAIIFIIPHMESISSLVVLTAAGSLLAAWVAAGSERISYAGLQAAFAFYLCIFQGFKPDTNLTVVRDRVIGILLGTLVSAVIFRYVWPEHAIDGLRATLARVLRRIAQLVRLPKAGTPIAADGRTAVTLHNSLSQDLDNTLRLSEMSAVESIMIQQDERFSPSALEHLTAHAQALSLITTALLRKTKVEEWHNLSEPVQAAETHLRCVIADGLERRAAAIESDHVPVMDDLEPAYHAWHETVKDVTGNDRPRLVRRLVAQIRLLE